MYRHTITFTTEAKPSPGDLTHLLAILNNKGNKCSRDYQITTEEVV